MRIGFMGSPEYSVATLQAIIQAGYTVPVVYSQPPKPKGRGKQISPCPVHQFAQDKGIDVHCPINFKQQSDLDILQSYDLDILVVVAYGIILPKAVLEIPKYGCLNGHASILPRWRGAAPIQRAIQAGDTKTGICIMQMDTGLDTGDVLQEKHIAILSDMTGGELHDVLSLESASEMVKVLEHIKQNIPPKPEKQTDIGITYAHKLQKSESAIQWQNTAQDIYNTTRAFTPFPAASTNLGGMVLKILQMQIVEIEVLTQYISQLNFTPTAGQIISVKPLVIACGTGAIEILQVQKSGKKPMRTKDLLNGMALELGTQCQ